MRRRTVLAGVAALAGCGASSETDTPSPEQVRSETRAVPAGASLVVSNRGRPRYVTVVVYDGERTVFSASRRYAARGDGATARFDGVVAAEGTYRVVVETAAGRRETVEWRLEAPVGRFVLELGEILEAAHLLACTPDCPPVSGRGRADLSGALAGAKPHTLRSPAESGYAVTLVNRAAARKRVDVELDYDGREALAYRYRIPPGVRLELPTLEPGPSFAVRVRTAGDAWTAAWREADELTVPLRVDAEGVVLDCAEGTATLGVSTDGGQGRVTVTARRDGRVVAERTLSSSVREPVYVEEYLPEPGVYDVRAVRQSGASERRTVLVCGRTYLRVRLTRDGVAVEPFVEGRDDGGEYGSD